MASTTSPTAGPGAAVRRPFRLEDEHLAIDLGSARAVFTTRRGGYSSGPYASLNLGRWTDDAPERVERNRRLLARRLGVRFAYGRQVHGTRVLVASRPTEPIGEGDAGSAAREVPEADGHATSTRGVAAMVLTADCLPVAVAGPGAVAMLHAGWRGLAGGIIAHGVDAVRELAEPDSPLAAAIGPGAGPCCYRVGEDVHARFAGLGLEVRRGANLDLKAAARELLVRAGVEEIHDCERCTICGDPTWFFSHRRDGGVTGRQAGLAWLR